LTPSLALQILGGKTQGIEYGPGQPYADGHQGVDHLADPHFPDEAEQPQGGIKI
jgi:hypothetical protein